MAATNTKPRPWLMTELHHASRLWKDGLTQREIASKVGRDVGSLKHKAKERRDLFPRRSQSRGDLVDSVHMKFQITPYLHKLVKEEAKARGISINMLMRETLRDRFVRKLWKPQESTLIEKIKYSNGSKV